MSSVPLHEFDGSERPDPELVSTPTRAPEASGAFAPIRFEDFYTHPMHPDAWPTSGWAGFLKEHRKYMLSVALKFTPDLNAAEDLVQEALIGLMTKPWTFSPGANEALRVWIRRNVKSVVARTLKPWRARFGSLDERRDRDIPGDRPPRRHEITEDDYAEMYETAKRGVRKRFRDKAWRAYEEVYEKGMDTQEAARLLGTSPNAIYIHGCRILAMLREEAARLLAAR